MPQALSDLDRAIIERDEDRIDDVSQAYYDERKGEIARQPTGKFPQQGENDEDDDLYPLGAGAVAASVQGGPAPTVLAAPGTPQIGSAPSAPGTPQLSFPSPNRPHTPGHLRNTPLQSAQPPMRTLPASAFQPHKAVRPARRVVVASPVAVGAVVAAGVVALMIGVSAWIFTHASSSPATGPKITPTQVFQPAMNISGNPLPGGSINLHGTGFPPGGHVTFSLDDTPLARAAAPSSLTSHAHISKLLPQVTEFGTADAKEVIVQPDGAFDTQITLPASWQAGSQHQIQAAVQGIQGQIHVDLTVQIQSPGTPVTPTPGTCIAVSNSQLSFTGITGKSDPPLQKIQISNCGSTGTWRAEVATDEGGSWLSTGSTGGTLAGGKQASISIRASNLHAKLAGGSYNGHITFTLGASAATIDVSLSVSSNPCIQADPTALNFNGVAGVSDPAGAQTIAISDCGDNEGWSATIATSEGTGWLLLDTSSGTLTGGESKTLAVIASNLNAQLSAGTYQGTIVITTGIKSVIINVKLVVSQPPCITANTTSLTFNGVEGSSDATGQRVNLTNCGGTGTWSATVAYNDTSSGWLSSETGGTLESGASKQATVTTSNLAARLKSGTYQGHITYTIATNTGTQALAITVTLTVYKAPCIAPGTTSLSFSGIAGSSDATAQNEIVTNCGDTGNWSATVSSSAAGWLSLNTTSGGLNAGGQQTIIVTASNLTGKLSAGTYTGTLTFTITTPHSGQSSATATVTLTVASPSCIKFTQVNGQATANANAASLVYSGVTGQSNPQAQTVTINNCGGDSGTWSAQVSSSSNWLSAGSTSGTLSKATSQDIAVSATNLSTPGSYTGQIVFTITSVSTAKTASITLNVTFNVQAGPCLTIAAVDGQAPSHPSSVTLSFSGTSGKSISNTHTVTVKNCGAAGTWSVVSSTSDGANWLAASTASGAISGQIAAGATQDIAVGVDSTSLQAGTYTGSLTFGIQTSTGQNSTIASVSFDVQTMPPCLTFSAINGKPPSGSTPYTLTFNGSAASEPGAQVVTLDNCGADGTVSAQITYGSGASTWLSTDLNNGTSLSAGNTLDMNITAFAANLKSNTQVTAQITFTITVGQKQYQEVLNIIFNVT